MTGTCFLQNNTYYYCCIYDSYCPYYLVSLLSEPHVANLPPKKKYSQNKVSKTAGTRCSESTGSRTRHPPCWACRAFPGFVLMHTILWQNL